MKINVSISAIANLIAQINADNAGLNLTEAQVTIGAPSARTPDANTNNTTLDLAAVAGQGYSGTKTITYMRLGMDSGVVTPVTGLTVTAANTQAEVLTMAATDMGLVEAELEVTAFTAPVDSSTPGSITIQPKATSLLYVGAAKTLDLVINNTKPLGTALTNGDLTGFNPA